MRNRPATTFVAAVIVLAFIRQIQLAAMLNIGSPLEIIMHASDPEVLLKAGAAYIGMDVRHEWWRMLVSTFVHGGILHLLVNLVALLQIGHLLEVFFGSTSFVLSFLVGMVVAALAIFIVPASSGLVYVGASGAIFALAGTLIVGLRRVWREERERWSHRLSSNLVGCVGLNIVAGLIVSAIASWAGAGFVVANTAHVAGFLAGATLGLMPLRIRRNAATQRLIRKLDPPAPRPPASPGQPYDA